MNKMGDTIEHMDLEIEQKDSKTIVLENKLGLPDSKIIEEMNNLELKSIIQKKR